jgi:hypothetical protein
MLRAIPVEEVVVLGAGFSKAVADVMPTADELGQLATEMAEIADAPKFADGRFEVWLSRLAEPQPDLSAAQNSENHSKFTRLLEAIYEVMTSAQEQVQEIPVWAARLMTALHYRRSVVITFNYDTLVERAIESIPIWDFDVGGSSESAFLGVTPRLGLAQSRAGKIGWLNLIADIPALPSPMRSQEKLAPSFRLLKLHGSLNWYWVPGDNSGATLNSWHLLDSHHDGERDRFLPGREPFIVPPAATKSPYFNNPIMRQTWAEAGKALMRADSVHFVGYSIPTTDLLSSSMIADGLAGRAPSVSLVNRAYAEPRDRLERLVEAELDVISSVRVWADDLVTEASSQVGHQLAGATGRNLSDTLVGVGWNPTQWGYVTDATQRDGALVVTVTDLAGRDSSNRKDIVRLPGLIAAAKGASNTVARFQNRRESPIVGLDSFGRETGPGQLHQLLIPADPPDAVAFG